MTAEDYLIETPSLLLRPFILSDTNIFFKLSQEKGMQKWIPDQVFADENQAKDVLKYLIEHYKEPLSPSDKPLVLGVELKKNNLLIGHVGLSAIPDGIEIGYAIGESHQKNGYATEAVSKMSLWAVQNLSVLEIYGIVASENLASCRVLEKSKYQLIKEKEMMLHNILRSVKIYKYSV